METKPEPSLTEIKHAIPARCFESHLGFSLCFVIRDLGLCLLFASVLYGSRAYLGNNVVINILYVLAQGTLFWGIFTLGHDCGHSAFSRYHRINWLVGLVLHSLILTPYEPWRLSHRSHHKNTCHLSREEIFYPDPPRSHTYLAVFLGAAWFVYAALLNVPGRRRAYYYVLDGELRERWLPISLSFAGIGSVGCALLYAGHHLGWMVVLLYYLGPLFVFGSWLVVVTFLHHNDADTPWYTDKSWSVVRGALSSVDRDYGWLINHVTHHINLHQIHHLFPNIPHYHLPRATTAFRAAFPGLSRIRHGSNVVDFWAGFSDWACHADVVPDSAGIFRYAAIKSTITQ